MSSTRRRVLAAFALAQTSLLGGCFGNLDEGTDASTQSPPRSSAPQTAAPTTAGNDTATSTQTATPVDNADLATSTANVLAEFEWFRTEYDAAIRGFQSRVNGVMGVLSELESATEPTESDVTAFRGATTQVANYVTSTLTPHFAVAPALRTGDNVFVRDFERGVTRGDVDLRDAAISRARVFYQRVISNAHIEHELSRRPVYGTLYDLLVPDGATNRVVAMVSVEDGFVTWAHPDRTESTATDGVHRHTHEFPSGHRTYTHAHPNSGVHPLNEHTNEPKYNELYAYGDDGVALLEDTTTYRERLDDYEPVLTGLFEPVRSPDREYGVTIMVGTTDASFDVSPVYAERFATPERAERAVTGDGDGDGGAVSAEGTAGFAGRRWDRVFYQVDDTTVYAYRIRAGASVVTAIPSDVPWERRPEWAAELGSTWLATRPGDAD
jgi:hypothetical protein